MEKGKGKMEGGQWKMESRNGKMEAEDGTNYVKSHSPFSILHFPSSILQSPISILLLTLLAFGLRTAHLAGPPLNGDEAFTVLLTDRGWAGMLEAMRTTEPNPPLHFFALRMWMAGAGRNEFSVRFLSALFGVLTVPLTYELGRRLLGRWVGLAAALLAAVNPYLVWYSHFARAYSLYLSLTLASLVLALRCGLQIADRESRIADSQHYLTPHRSPGRWLAYVGVTATALYTHYFAFLFLIAQNLIFLLSNWRHINSKFEIRNSKSGQTWRTWFSAQAAVAVLVAPWLILTGPMLLSHEKAWLTYTSPAAGVWRALRAYSSSVDVHGLAAVLTAMLFTIVLTVGIVAVWRVDRWALTVLGTYSFAPLAIVLLGSLIRPIFLERYLIGVVPAFLVLVAAGVVPSRIAYRVSRITDQEYAIRSTQYVMRTPHHASRITPLRGLALIALITLVASGFLAPPFGTDFADWRGVARALEARVAADDVVIQNYPDPAFAYYYRGPAECIVLPAEVPVPRQATDEALRALLRKHDRLWLLPLRDPTWDADGFVWSWLDRRAELLSDEWVAGHHVLAYRVSSEPAPDIQQRVEWRLGDVALLVAYWVDAARVAPGQSIALTLFWEPLRTTDVSYTVFVHLWDGQTIWGQKDGQPQACPEPCTVPSPSTVLRTGLSRGRRAGAWPTTEWFPGDLIVDSRQVPVDPDTPPGGYELIAGLYRLDTGERLPVYDASGRPRGDYVPITEMRVRP
ncbi:MAG: glycosyltransferase family 39 protein [Anaerolineae bacterium]